MASALSSADESAVIESNVKALEVLLDEFFSDVSNDRKAEIERMLTTFGEQVNWINWSINQILRLYLVSVVS